jgi:putative phage-type endonuclease
MNQQTPEWFAQRVGKVTASRIADVMAKVKSGEAASRANYRAQLVAERLTGVPAESYSNASMQWGTETEPYARMAYEASTGNLVLETGFALHPEIGFSGASPDGLIGDDGLVEIKCPNTATHIDYLLSKSVPEKYKPQMAWQMACTEREWCDFISYDPRLPDDLRLFVVRYERDKDYIDELEAAVIKFLSEVENTVLQLTDIQLRKAA